MTYVWEGRKDIRKHTTIASHTITYTAKQPCDPTPYTNTHINKQRMTPHHNIPTQQPTTPHHYIHTIQQPFSPAVSPQHVECSAAVVDELAKLCTVSSPHDKGHLWRKHKGSLIPVGCVCMLLSECTLLCVHV